MEQAGQATHDEICAGALTHYECVASKAGEWNATVRHAIEYYRHKPEHEDALRKAEAEREELKRLRDESFVREEQYRADLAKANDVMKMLQAKAASEYRRGVEDVMKVVEEELDLCSREEARDNGCGRDKAFYARLDSLLPPPEAQQEGK